MSGIEIGPIHHKISLYCDDVLLFLSNPETSIARAVEIISDFSRFSGYKINYSKSEAMPLTPDLPWSPTCSAPFRWSPSGFVYLGIKIFLSFLTPIHSNPDFPPGLEDHSFSLWAIRGIKTIGDLVVNDTLMSFDQFREKYNLQQNHFFRERRQHGLVTKWPTKETHKDGS